MQIVSIRMKYQDLFSGKNKQKKQYKNMINL